MASNQSISSMSNPKVKAAVKLRESKHRRATGRFLIESPRDYLRVREIGLCVPQLFLHGPFLNDDERIEFYHERGVWHHAQDVREVTEPVLRKLAYRENPTGLVAVVEQPNWSLEAIEWRDDSLVLVAQGLAKPGNLGAMARTAAAAGCAAMIVVDAVVDPFNPNAIRASTGAVFSLPIVCADSDDCLAVLEREKVKPFAAALREGAVDHSEANYCGRVAMIIGAEDRGLDETWLAYCEKLGQVVRIPMVEGAVDSLNASVAAGVLLFEVNRQRSASC